MSKIYLDEIDTTMTSTMFSTLKVDSGNSLDINGTLNSFIESKTHLVGPQWDKLRSKMAEYSKALEKRTTVGEKLSDVINEALTMLKNYLGDDLMLDSSMLPEYKRQKANCESSITQLYSMMRETKEVTRYNDKGEKITTSVKVYDTDAIEKQIIVAEETLKELDRIIDKIEHLDEVYSKAEALFTNVVSEINEFKNIVSSIKPSSKVVYRG